MKYLMPQKKYFIDIQCVISLVAKLIISRVTL